MAVDIIAAFEQDPPPLDFVFPSFLAGTVGALVAPGATGKSFWALQAAMAVAGGADADLLDLQPSDSGSVVYIAGEDPEIVLQHRLHAIGERLNARARQEIAENMQIHSIIGRRINVMRDAELKNLIAMCNGARLLVLDTFSRMHECDENDNGKMSQVVSRLEAVAAETGAAVLFLHHASKFSAQNGALDQQQAARGASAIIDNARWCGYVARMTKDEAKCLSYDLEKPIQEEKRGFFLRYGVSKPNYSATPDDRWYIREVGGVLLPVTLAVVAKSGGVKREQA